MAIEKIIKINVDQVQAAGGLEKFTQSLEKTETKTQSLRTELKNLKQQLATLDEGTAEYNKIAQKAGEVSDKIGDISTRIKNLGSDTRKIDGVVQGVQTLSGAFTVATSASALFGSENKELQETMLKVESAIGLTVGIQSIANALQKESALYIGLSTTATKLQTGFQLAYTAVVGGTTGALKALKVALVSTGVGALVVGLGLLIAKLTESKESTEDVEKAQKSLNDEIERGSKLYDDYSKSIEFSTKSKVLNAKIAGASEKEVRELEKKGVKSLIENLKEEENSLRKSLDNKNANAETQKKITDSITSNKKEQSNLSRQIDLDDLTFDLSIADKKREALQKQKEESKKKKEEAKAQEKKDADELKANLQKQKDDTILLQNEIITAIGESQDKNIEGQISAQETEIRIAKEKYFRLIEIAKQFELDSSDIQIQQANELNDINLKYQQQKYDADKVQADKDKLITEEVAKNKEETLRNNYNNLQNILSLAGGKFSKIGKALAIADVVRSAYKSISTTVSSISEANAKAIAASPLTGGQPFVTANVIQGALAIGSTIASSAKSIQAINGDSKSVSGGGSGGNSGGGGSGGSAPPSFNIVGQNPNNQLAQSIANKQQQPIEAYVVSGNITNAQSGDRNRISTATFN